MDREVIFFPDLGAFDSWSRKAEQVKRAVSCKIVVSDYLETNATEEQRSQGLDIADFLVQRDPETGWAITVHGYPVFWDHPVDTNLYLNKI